MLLESPIGAGPDSVVACFDPDGPLAGKLPGYAYREQQVHVAQAVEEAMLRGKVCLVEAGTGVGKSLAYLVPAVRAALAGKRTLISTHTISLQNQLLHQDIPLVLTALATAPSAVPVTLMKGRGNYLCKQDLEYARQDLILEADPLFRKVLSWNRAPGCSGDIADLPFAFSGWSEIAANRDTCRGRQCAHFDNCYYFDMLRAASSGKIIVVNHALFFSDLALRSVDPEARIVPEYDHVVFDEAHHLEDVATDAFSVDFGSRRIPALIERVRHVKSLDQPASRLQALDELNAQLFEPFLSYGRPAYLLDEALGQPGADGAGELTRRLGETLAALVGDLESAGARSATLRERLDGPVSTARRASYDLNAIFAPAEEDQVRWVELSGEAGGRRRQRVAMVRRTPVSVAGALREHLWQDLAAEGRSAVLTSATLSDSGGFGYVRERLGMPSSAIERIAGSPFDFRAQALLYVPRGLPEPAQTNVRTTELADETERIVTLTRGRAFLLFTSLAVMQAVYETLSGRLPFPLFKQGDRPAPRLLDAFRNSGNGCLLGSQTFWEGVDVPGDALSCVVIDRLPFAAPDSPITRARCEAITNAGGDWFRDYALPLAQMRLKQGFGRLIRTQQDRGIVCVLDPRLLTRGYGREFLRFLPPAPVVTEWPEVVQFWRQG